MPCRRQLTTTYRDVLAEIAPELQVPFSAHPGESSCHILPALLPADVDRQEFMLQMKAQGIQTSIHYPPVHLFQAYQDAQDQARKSGTDRSGRQAPGDAAAFPLDAG